MERQGELGRHSYEFFPLPEEPEEGGIRHHPHRGQQGPPKPGRPPAKFQMRRRRTTTTDDDELDEFMDGISGQHIDRQYNLEKHTLKYVTHLPGDTEEDATRMRQWLVLDDDIQSIDDDEYYRRDPNDRDDLVHMDDDSREREALRRRERREKGLQSRYRGTKKELEEMRNSLLAITVAGRRQRLEE
eukprot:4910691-Amphidinium_carterae.1